MKFEIWRDCRTEVVKFRGSFTIQELCNVRMPSSLKTLVFANTHDLPHEYLTALAAIYALHREQHESTNVGRET